ncbi:hypothetical protein C8A03DRAFT_12146 [Achaetomium macrosporum]|uniref:DUF1365-domain-containing protein n=1 Tax=Achaetomium macrosporum TaxID=79813 RepID=A0AAN7CGJ6_9PEZI|nr:hypothetical protein C8A03DRAFT_12146 [Achaetomium macrosporum]
MGIPQIAYLAAAFMAICFPLSGPIDAAVLAFFSVIRQRHLLAGLLDLMPSREAFKATIIIFSILLLSISALFWVLRALRGEVRTQQWDGPGKVLMYPCRTFHSRLFPKEHSFDYPYLTVGVPVGFEGNAGGMVSVRAKRTSGLSSRYFLLTQLSRAWFTIDAGDYLERGKSELGLRGKLDDYLRKQGADPATYPYAYLVTAPRFLGYNFNPASFWYLYDAEKRLAAMILDVNNTFGERRLYFLTSGTDRQFQFDCASGLQMNEGTTFEQSWPKDFHVSPFNSRKGSYTLSTYDPLGPVMQGTGPISITITLISSKGHPKLVVRLCPESAALDPCTMTTYQKFKFLASWWWVGFVTFPLILKEAFRLFFHHTLHVWYRPEPLKGTIARRADPTERKLEPIFRRYLQHLVEQSTTPLAVKYIPSGMSHGIERVMVSRAARDKAGTVQSLEFRVLTPVFYKRFKPRPTLESSIFSEYAYFETIQHLRDRPERIVRPLTSSAKSTEQARPLDIRNFHKSSMDAYVLAHESSEARATYMRCVLKLFLTDRLAFGSMPFLEAQRLLAKACFAWFILSVL